MGARYRIVCADLPGAGAEAREVEPPTGGADPEQIAYLQYTSGHLGLHQRARRGRHHAFDGRELSRGRVAEVPPEHGDARWLVACGAPAGQLVRIRDTADGTVLPPDRVGGIQVSGPNLVKGYWGAPDRSAEVFADGRLRTGDLGLLYDGRLCITGRRKDVVIVDGVSHDANDLEETAASVLDGGTPNGVAAFGVDDGERERVVIVVEASQRALRGSGGEPSSLAAAVRRGIVEHHGISVGEVFLTRPGGIPKTSSGKQCRSACREAYGQGTLSRLPEARGGPRQAQPGGAAGRAGR